MPVYHIKGRGEVFGIRHRQINGSGEAAFTVDVLHGIFPVVLSLHDRIIDVCIREDDPGTSVLVDLFQLIEILIVEGLEGLIVVGVVGVVGAIVSGFIIALMARRNFVLANGDVLGMSNEVGRLFVLLFMSIALYYI